MSTINGKTFADHYIDLPLEDGTVVCVGYTWKSGSPDSYWEQGDPPEAEIVSCWRKDNETDVTLTDDQADKLYVLIFEKHEEDYSGYPDDILDYS